jgi:uncharacterized protein (DUF1778 family)
MTTTSKASPRAGRGVRPVSFQVTLEYADWLARAARHDRSTVATFLDRAAIDRARAIGLDEPAPSRTPRIGSGVEPTRSEA